MQTQQLKTQSLGQRAQYRSQRDRALAIRLSDLDHLPGDGLGVFCWSDVRPLAGVAGLVDWRLCGALSAALQRDVLTGRGGEVLMLPATRRLGRRPIFLFGLGEAGDWNPSMLQRGRDWAVDVMRKAGVAHVVLGAPSVSSAAAGDTPYDIETTFTHICAPRVQDDFTLVVAQ